MYAEVIIPLALPKNFTWVVPDHLRETALRGCRVEVVLGKQKKYAGIIKRLHQQAPEHFEPKEIIHVLDAEPIVNDQQLQLWEWMATYYMCSEGEVMAAALPAHFKLSSESILVFNEEAGEDFSDLDQQEFLVAEALLIKKQLKMEEVQQLLDSLKTYPVIKKLIDRKICFVWETLRDTYVPKLQTYVTLNGQYRSEAELEELLNNWSRAPKQLDLLLAYLHLSKTSGEVSKPELLKKSGASDAQLKGLVEKQILNLEKRRVDRLPFLAKETNIDFELSPSQQEALDRVNEALESKQVCLLHGITSSGKTLIYIKLIAAFLKTGKQVLFLLPEIALTAQIIRRLQKHFGGLIGIYHSKFSQNERVEIWNNVKKGELKVVLGARSALFLPFTNLGLIVVDEEHDSSYKQQDPAPRYQARDSAIYYASVFGAKVVLGTATPSMESYYNASNGKYGYVELTERFGGLALPAIELIDTRPMMGKDMSRVMISEPLKKAVEETVSKGRQVILFQNRRGYSPYQICQVCGWIPHCRYCDVSLNFHKNTNKLHCHYCGTVYPPIHSCLACGSDRFVQRNFGTEKIEEQLEEIFPEMRIARRDIDSVRGKQAHDNLIQQFEQQKIDILVGTQMVVKGLDFEHVQLVGILDADSLLNFADFRVNERAFQMIEQVSGRAGRKGDSGKVLIQVANGQHPVLDMVMRHDYPRFFAQELESRRKFFYPPFSRIILLTFRHKLKDVVYEAAMGFEAALHQQYGKYMVGPAEPVVNRIRNQYLMELLLKLPRDAGVIASCKRDILDTVARMHQNKRFRSVVVIPDVDR